MNADRLLDVYEQISEAPDAIARLRRFVLDLAVRGKLVEQDAGDEPASDLLAKIASEKACLVERGILKPERAGKKAPTPVELFDLPQGWAWSPLQALCLTVTDGDHQPPPKAEEGVPFLVIGDVRTKTINYDVERKVSQEYFDGLDPMRKPRPGDLLYTLVGSFGIPVPVLSDTPFCVQRHIGILRPSEQMNLSALALFMESDFAFTQAEAAATGIAQKTVSLAGLRTMILPVPPLAEQHRIVAKVDELMALCDRLEEARKTREETRDKFTAATLARLTAPEAAAASETDSTNAPSGAAPNQTGPENAATGSTSDTVSGQTSDFRTHARFAIESLPALTSRPDQIKSLRQTILNLAVRGKLVEQDPADEPASQLLIEIAAHKKLRAISAKDKKAGQISAIDVRDRFNLPRTWLWARFGDLTISRDGERKPVSKTERAERAKNYDYYGASGVIDKIDDYLFDKPLLLIGEDGANLINRSTPIAFIARGQYWVNNHAHVLDGLNEHLLRYLELFINATDLKPFVTGTAQPKMNQAKMNSIPVAVPPIAEQHRIVAKVDALMAICDQLEAALTSADTTRTRLLETLLHEALEPATDVLKATE